MRYHKTDQYMYYRSLKLRREGDMDGKFICGKNYKNAPNLRKDMEIYTQES